MRIVKDPHTPLNTRIYAASKLVDASREIQNALEVLKGDIRRECQPVEVGGEPQVQSFPGEGGSQAVVTVYPPSVKMNPFPIDKTRAILGGHFDRIFKLGASLRSHSMQAFEGLTPDQRKWLSQWLKVEESTARVSFRFEPIP